MHNDMPVYPKEEEGPGSNPGCWRFESSHWQFWSSSPTSAETQVLGTWCSGFESQGDHLEWSAVIGTLWRLGRVDNIGGC